MPRHRNKGQQIQSGMNWATAAKQTSVSAQPARPVQQTLVPAQQTQQTTVPVQPTRPAQQTQQPMQDQKRGFNRFGLELYDEIHAAQLIISDHDRRFLNDEKLIRKIYGEYDNVGKYLIVDTNATTLIFSGNNQPPVKITYRIVFGITDDDFSEYAESTIYDNTVHHPHFVEDTGIELNLDSADFQTDLMQILPSVVDFIECHGHKCRRKARLDDGNIYCLSCYGNPYEADNYSELIGLMKAKIPFNSINKKSILLLEKKEQTLTSCDADIKQMSSHIEEMARKRAEMQYMQTEIDTLEERIKERIECMRQATEKTKEALEKMLKHFKIASVNECDQIIGEMVRTQTSMYKEIQRRIDDEKNRILQSQIAQLDAQRQLLEQQLVKKN